MKDLGARAFSYGYASPVLMAATYNDDGTVNVMNLHEVARTNAGDLVCCIGKPKKTHENIEKRKAFTLTLANGSLMKEIDYLGTVSGYRVPDKFERTGLKAVKSKNDDAPIIVGSPVVITMKYQAAQVWEQAKSEPSSPNLTQMSHQKLTVRL